MTLTLESINLTKQRCRADTRSPAASLAMKALFIGLNNRSNPNLQFTAVQGLETADVVAADVACRVYAVYARKPTASTVNAFLKASDNATTCSAADWAAKYIGTGGGGQEHMHIYPDGLIMASGFTIGCHTANNGTSKSLVADAPVGFAIVGAV